jgi:hypothetical protein
MANHQNFMRTHAFEPSPWRGHHAATRAALEAIILRGPDGLSPRRSRAEFILVGACEFWAAAMNREMLRHLEGSAFLRLRTAEESFAGIHATAAKAAVRLARLRMRVAAAPVPLREIAVQLEAELTALKEPVDDFIAEFAREHVLPGPTVGADTGAL